MTMDQTRYDRGMAMRRKVLGDTYVDRAIANTDDFNRDFQALLTEYAWGAVWGDERLALRDRSILNLGTHAPAQTTTSASCPGAIRGNMPRLQFCFVARNLCVASR